MTISYLSLKCDQCGIERTLYYVDTSHGERMIAEADFLVIHSGHEATVGIDVANRHTYDPETEKVIKKPKKNKTKTS